MKVVSTNIPLITAHWAKIGQQILYFIFTKFLMQTLSEKGEIGFIEAKPSLLFFTSEFG